MTQLHILVVLDTKTGEMHIGSPEEAPVDPSETAFQDPEWRRMTDAETNYVIFVEDRIAKIFDVLTMPSLKRFKKWKPS